MDNSDLDRIIELYKLSILIKNNHNEDFVKLFAIKYIDYYVGRLEFINGIKNIPNIDAPIIKYNACLIDK